MDLYVRPHRAGGRQFLLREKLTMVLGEPQQFVLEVEADVTGKIFFLLIHPYYQ